MEKDNGEMTSVKQMIYIFSHSILTKYHYIYFTDEKPCLREVNLPMVTKLKCSKAKILFRVDTKIRLTI